MKYRVIYGEDKETGIYTYVVQKKKLFVFWKDVYYAVNELDAYKHKRKLIDKEDNSVQALRT